MDLQVPNSRERALWKKAWRFHDQFSQRVALSRARLEYASLLYDFAVRHGVKVTLSVPGWWDSMNRSINQVSSLAYRIGVVMDAAERGELAARPTPDGSDLDIVAPEPLDPKWKQYQIAAGDLPPGGELGIAPLIVLGIIVAVVIGGVLTLTMMSNAYSKKIDRDIGLATLEAEKTFCEDPNSAICKAWFTKKKTTPAKKARGAIDYLLGEGAGKKVAGGLVAVLVGGVAYWLYTTRPKKAA